MPGATSAAARIASSLALAVAAFVVPAFADAATATSASDDILWAGSGGGWRAMVAQSAYAQLFSNLGILGDNNDNDDGISIKPKIKVMTGTSGTSWFLSQLAFSQNYYDSIIVNGTPRSLGDLTQAWMEAYGTTQTDLPNDCGALQAFCDTNFTDQMGEEFTALIQITHYYNQSWPQVAYAMYDAASATYNDTGITSVKATSEMKLAKMNGIDVCMHTSVLPNARAFDTNTITYLAKDYRNTSSSYTVPLPYSYCVGDESAEWLPEELPGGNFYNINPNASFTQSNVIKGFPMIPTKESDGLYTTPYHDKDSNDTVTHLPPQEMSHPFGGDPTALQISTASSSFLGYLSEEPASYFAQYISVVEYNIQQSSTLSFQQKIEMKAAIRQIQNKLWSSGLMSNAATMSGWTEANPVNIPPATAMNYWFVDGSYTDTVAAAPAVARYQKLHGTSNPIKLIISNNNYYSDSLNDILYFFNYGGNKDKTPGSFIWPLSFGGGYQGSPQMTKQIFEEDMTAEMLHSMFVPVEGTNLTIAVLPAATTVDNEAFGVKAGQKVSIAVINLNSDITTYIASEPVITATTPALVSLAESIASSQDLAVNVAAFVGLSSHTDDESSSNEDVTSSTTTDDETSDEVSTTAVAPTVESTTSSSSSSSSRLTSLLSWVIVGNLLISLP